MAGPKFEFYVINEDFNAKKMVMFNIFQNINVYNWTLEEVRKYLRSPKKYKYVKLGRGSEEDTIYYGFEAFCLELRSILMNQLWSRCEYEIVISPLICKDEEEEKSRQEKWDCFGQCEDNIPMIAREVIYQYKQWKKGENNE